MASKYKAIITFLEESIARGTYAVGARLPSESELVMQFGTSRPTVARALREMQSAGLIERRAGSGSFVSKPASLAPRRLFGLLIPGLGDTEIFGSICAQIVLEAELGQHGLLWGQLSTFAEPRAKAERTVEPYIRQGVAGVFFAPLELSAGKDELNHEVVRLLEKAGIPVVLLDRDLVPFPERSGLDLIGIDNYAAGFTLAQHLMSRGCRRVNFFAKPFSAGTVEARIGGAFRALHVAGHPPADDWVCISDASDIEAVRARFGEQLPDAIICANDKTAAELMRSLEGMGVRVPADVKVIGFDDVRYAGLLRPSLTTIRQPCTEMGSVAMRVMLDRVADPKLPARSVLLPFQLVVRDSSGQG